MIHYRTPAEIELIRKSALLVGEAIMNKSRVTMNLLRVGDMKMRTWFFVFIA
jgi:hypothetical protein